MENVTYKSVVNTNALLEFILEKLKSGDNGCFEYDLKRLALLADFQKFVTEQAYVAKISNEN